MKDGCRRDQAQKLHMQEILASAKPRILPRCGTGIPRDIKISSCPILFEPIKVIKFKDSDFWHIVFTSASESASLFHPANYTILRDLCVPATLQVNIAVKLKLAPESATDPPQYRRSLGGTEGFDYQRQRVPSPNLPSLRLTSHSLSVPATRQLFSYLYSHRKKSANAAINLFSKIPPHSPNSLLA